MKTIYVIILVSAASLFVGKAYGQELATKQGKSTADSSEAALKEWEESKADEQLQNLEHKEKVAKSEKREAKRELKEKRKALKAEKKAQKARKRADDLSKKAVEE